MRTRPFLSTADARVLMLAGRAEAERRGLESSIAIVDSAGVPILLERLENARLHTPEAAIAKARTAAITRTATEDLQHQIQDNAALLSFPGRLPLTGGLPILYRGEVVGGIGASGGSPDEDLAVCHAALSAVPV